MAAPQHAQRRPRADQQMTTKRLAQLIPEIRTTAVLAGPLVVGQISAALIGFVDSVIAGHHGTQTLAAVSVATAILWLPIMLPLGVLMSIPPTVSEMDGAGRRAEVGPFFRQALWIAVALAALLFTFLSFAPAFMRAFGIDAQIIPGAADFLHAVRWGVPGMCLYFCMRYLSEGMHWTTPTMALSVMGVAILAPVGYVLTFGLLGFPEMGAEGLGVASAIVMWAQAIGFVAILLKSRRFADLQLFSHFEFPRWDVIAKTLKVGLPIGVMVLMEGGLFVTTTLLMGKLGTVISSSHQIAINIATLCFMIPLGVAEATTVRVGHAMGRRDYYGVRRAMYAGLAIVLFSQVISASVMVFGNEQLARLYTDDVTVIALASALMMFAATFQFPDGVQVMSAATLRGLKDTTVPMWMAIISYWLVGMPVGIYLGFEREMGPRGMWIGLISGLTVAAILLNYRARRTIARLIASTA